MYKYHRVVLSIYASFDNTGEIFDVIEVVSIYLSDAYISSRCFDFLLWLLQHEERSLMLQKKQVFGRGRQMCKYHRVVFSIYAGFDNTGRDI